LSNLPRLAPTCNYDPLEESLTQDRVVISARSDTTRDKLLQTTNLILTTVIDIDKDEHEHCEESRLRMHEDKRAKREVDKKDA
jgi:hypothetical protein